jgi:acyl-CoA reductase-like NAD-dependent aldehyde dehydrogenase
MKRRGAKSPPYVALAQQEGAAVLDRRQAAQRADPPGWLVLRTHGAWRGDPGQRVAQEEIFGPVLAVIKVGSLDEAMG